MIDQSGTTNATLAEIFGRAASTFGGMGNFVHFGGRLVAHAQLNEGSRVLDVATGRGAVAFHAAKRVGSRGQVVGVDISAEMLRETAKELASGEWPMIELREMNAEHLNFPDASFDAVLCGFALWFFPHPERALREFRRVLKSAGRLALSTLAHDSPFHELVRETLRPYLSTIPEADKPEQSQRFATKAKLEAALQEAGFVDTGIVMEDFNAVAAGADAMWKHLWSTAYRRHLERMSEATLSEVRSDYFERLKAFTQPDGVHLTWRALIAVSTKGI